jgi:hypothetical protein
MTCPFKEPRRLPCEHLPPLLPSPLPSASIPSPPNVLSTPGTTPLPPPSQANSQANSTIVLYYHYIAANDIYLCIYLCMYPSFRFFQLPPSRIHFFALHSVLTGVTEA